MKRSLRTRLTIILIGLAVGPLLLVGAILVERSFTFQRRQALDLQTQVAQRVSSEVDAFLGGVETDLTLRAGEIRNLEDPDRAQLVSLLLGAFSTGPYRDVYEDFALLDGRGREQLLLSRSEVVPAEALRSRSGEDAFEVPRATRETYFSPVWFDESGEPFVTVGVPMTEPRSVQVSGVLVADIRFREVGDLIASTDVGQDQTVYVVDAGQQLVAHEDSSIDLQGSLFTVPEGTNRQTGLDGTNVVLATNTFEVGEQSLQVVAEKPALEALAFAYTAAITIAVVVALSLAIAAGLGFAVIVPQIVRPVEGLATTARAISEGDLKLQAEVSGEDEIGELASAFNAMTLRLRELIDDLANNVSELQASEAENEKLIRQLREASRLKDEFLATMSHELRTPLNATIGFTGILMMGKKLAENELHMVQRIRANSERLLALIDDILDISRIESGRLELVASPLDVRDLAEAVGSEIDVLASQKGLDLVVDVGAGVPDTIQMDEDAIRKIITNLMSNAVKFTDQGRVSLKVRLDNHNLIITVDDTGIGIPAHMHDIIFESFRQVDSSSTRKYSGTGLGLSIVRHLCTAMNGTVTVNSAVGSGSSFVVTLPLNETPLAERGGI